MGDSVAEGTVLEWRVKVGDAVAADDPLVEISTDKVDAEVPSPVAGTIAEILVEADRRCRRHGAVPHRGRSGRAERPRAAKAEPTEVKPRSRGTGDGNGGNATPVAARIASAHGMDVVRRHGLRPARPGHEGGRAGGGRGRRRRQPPAPPAEARAGRSPSAAPPRRS